MSLVPAAAVRSIRTAVEEMRNMSGFSENRKDSLVWMSSESLNAFPELLHGFTTRYGGVSEGIYSSLNLGFGRGDEAERVEENYRILCSALGLKTEDVIVTRQIHSDIVRKVSSADKKQRLSDPTPYEADALVTDEKGLVLTIFIADCIPVLLYAADSKAVGAAHAGWRGTVADIAGKTVETLCREYGGKTENIHAVIGEGIGRCCFETGPEVYKAVKALGLNCDMDVLAVDDRNGKYHVDLKEVNRQLLLCAGVPYGNITVSAECTRCMSDKYWSHRATNGERGVQAAFISLVEAE